LIARTKSRFRERPGRALCRRPEARRPGSAIGEGQNSRLLYVRLGLIFPDIDSVGHKLNVMEQVVDVPRQEIITRDNATVAVDGVAFY